MRARSSMPQLRQTGPLPGLRTKRPRLRLSATPALPRLPAQTPLKPGPNSIVTQPVMNPAPEGSPAGADMKALAGQLSALCLRPQAYGATKEQSLAAKHVKLATQAIRQADENAARAHASRPGKCAAWVLSLIHISEPTRLGMISYAVF